MKNNKPLFLLSNDDGVTAKGLNELIRFIRHLGDLVVVAPDCARSANSCALSVTVPVSYKLLKKEDGLTIYQCSGTPVDCIKLALHAILERTPDLILAGVNHGENAAVNVHYSGTMGIAIEGCLKGIPSIGFSLCDHSGDADFQPGAKYIQHIIEKILSGGLPELVCLNVNIPATSHLKGIKVCTQAKGYWESEWENCYRSGGNPYFWLSGSLVHLDRENQESDQWAISNGYVSVTPVRVDLTAYEYIDELNALLN